jgi:ATP-dependent protease HslVU (ClpYQ) peptidase subunit
MLFETDGVVCCLHKATLLVADATNSFELTGNGDVLEPEGGVVAIGSGGSYALGTVDMQKAVVRCCVDNDN